MTLIKFANIFIILNKDKVLSTELKKFRKLVA